MIWIILGIIYYIISSLLFLFLLEKEAFMCLSCFAIVMGLIPIIRVIYYIYVKFI